MDITVVQDALKVLENILKVAETSQDTNVKAFSSQGRDALKTISAQIRCGSGVLDGVCGKESIDITGTRNDLADTLNFGPNDPVTVTRNDLADTLNFGPNDPVTVPASISVRDAIVRTGKTIVADRIDPFVNVKDVLANSISDKTIAKGMTNDDRQTDSN